jgi:hypothetical protein
MALNSRVMRGMQNRAKDFVGQEIFRQGIPADEINTDMIAGAFNKWADQPQFQKDLAADTMMNRIKAQDTELGQRGNALLNDVLNNNINVDQLSTDDFNLIKGVRKNRQADEANFLVQRAAHGKFPTEIEKQTLNSDQIRDLDFDTEVALAKMHDSDVMNRAQNIRNAVVEGNIKVEDLTDEDLGLVDAVGKISDGNVREAFYNVREKRKLDKAQDFLNERLSKSGKNTVNTNEFINRTIASNDKFEQIKNERGVIGAGAFGAVVHGDNGTVMKLQPSAHNVMNNGLITPNDAIQEADNLENLRGLHMSPGVHSVETLGDGSTITVMDDLSKNFTTFGKILNERGIDNQVYDQDFASHLNVFPDYDLLPDDLRSIELQRQQQQARANLRGVELNDRHSNNVMINNMTNRPIQVDFGIVSKFVDTREQADAMALNAGRAMSAAGMREEGAMLINQVRALEDAGDFTNALDVARQGNAIAQKLKGVRKVPSVKEVLSKSDIPF